MKKIGIYVNGNIIVTIYDDGTKVRRIPDGQRPEPEFPESMDLKITNRCDLRCPMCAENSVPIGSHADLNNPLLKTISQYTELAIGGGNPLEHPGLVDFLKRMKEQKVICNLTVNVQHFLKHRHWLKVMSEEKLIYGLGISIPDEIPDGFDGVEDFPNAVIHTIVGYTPMKTYKQLENKNLNLLILGFKTKGKGRECINKRSSSVVTNTEALAKDVFDMRPKFKAIAFDNLALVQLMIRNQMHDGEWHKFYMGDDGEYTMYIDLVSRKYGISSTHPLKDIDEKSITDLFQKVRLKE